MSIIKDQSRGYVKLEVFYSDCKNNVLKHIGPDILSGRAAPQRVIYLAKQYR